MDKWLIKVNKNTCDNASSVPCVSSTSTEVKQKLSVSGTKSTRKRKYNEAFLQYEFTFITQNGEEQPLCLICNEILASESLKPAKLKRHLELKHCSDVSKPVSYFERLLQASQEQKKSFEQQVQVHAKYLRASHEASYLIAKSKKPFTVGEELVHPVAVKIAKIVLGSAHALEVKKNSFVQ